MKVLHVIPSLSLVHGGPTHALLLMERTLARLGVEVETATTDDGGLPLGAGPQAHRDPRSGVLRHTFKKRLGFYKVAPSFLPWIEREVRRYDIVHVHALFSFTSWAACRAARRAGVPYIVRPLGTLSTYGLTQRRPWLKRASVAMIERPLLRGAAAVHFTSAQEAQEARVLGVAWREAIIPLGVEEPATPEDPTDTTSCSDAGPCILFLSRLDPKKNVEGLLRATTLLRPQWPDLRLRIVGDGDPGYVSQLRALSAELGLASCTEWAGRLDGAAKTEALATADVYVLPSYSENFGIAAAEALFAGLPCVLGSGVALAQQAAMAGAALETGTDAASIAQAIQHIIGSPAEALAMRQRAVAFARREFSAETMGERLKSLYEEILRK